MLKETTVELDESLKSFHSWQEVARVTEQELRNRAWNYTIVLRAMKEREEKLEAPQYNTVQLVLRNDDRFEFAFNIDEVKPPIPHNNIEEFVDVQILQVLDEYITTPDDLDEVAKDDEEK
jgi:hypothetical protein